MGKRKDFSGLTFWRLTLISFHSMSNSGHQNWNCRCSCGNLVVLGVDRIIIGNTKSCGCLKVKHGEAGRKTKEYKTWLSIRRRCSNDDLKYYAGKGIKLCDRWLESYDNFIADMGRAPSPKHSIDRINNDGNYEPENCRWATPKEQCNNRSNNKIFIYNGVARTLSQWCNHFNLDYQAVHGRLKRNRTFKQAINDSGKSNLII